MMLSRNFKLEASPVGESLSQKDKKSRKRKGEEDILKTKKTT